MITQATLAVRRAPAVKLNEGWVFDSWGAGCEAFRTMEQAGDAGDVCRLSDEAETALNAAASGHDAPGPCLAVVGWEGEEADVTRRAERTRAHLEAAGARPLGEDAGARAGRNYFAGPYLRDELLGMGVLVETLETATTWSRLQELYTAVGDALRGALAARGTDALVMCHVSHLYRSGASLYFSFFAPPGARRGARAVAGRQDRGLRRDRLARRAPSRTTTRSGSTTRRGWLRRWGRPASRRCVGSSRGSTPQGS